MLRYNTNRRARFRVVLVVVPVVLLVRCICVPPASHICPQCARGPPPFARTEAFASDAVPPHAGSVGFLSTPRASAWHSSSFACPPSAVGAEQITAQIDRDCIARSTLLATMLATMLANSTRLTMAITHDTHAHSASSIRRSAPRALIDRQYIDGHRVHRERGRVVNGNTTTAQFYIQSARWAIRECAGSKTRQPRRTIASEWMAVVHTFYRESRPQRQRQRQRRRNAQTAAL